MTNRDKPDFTVTELIDRLRPMAEELNKESDEATKILEDFEKALNALNLGVGVWIQEDNLGYGCHEGKWGLLGAEYKRSNKPDLSTRIIFKRLLDTKRTTRIEAVPLLPKLVEHLKISLYEEARNVKRSAADDQ